MDITGRASGLGLATTTRLAEAGAHVLLDPPDSDGERGASTVKSSAASATAGVTHEDAATAILVSERAGDGDRPLDTDLFLDPVGEQR